MASSALAEVPLLVTEPRSEKTSPAAPESVGSSLELLTEDGLELALLLGLVLGENFGCDSSSLSRVLREENSEGLAEGSCPECSDLATR